MKIKSELPSPLSAFGKQERRLSSSFLYGSKIRLQFLSTDLIDKEGER